MKVLIAFDESAASSRAARVATRLFSGEDVAFLVINVAVLPMPSMGKQGYGLVAAVGMYKRLLEPDGQAEADLLARAEMAGVPHPVAVVGYGDPVSLIHATAEEHGVDVIVIGSHDKTALQRLFDPSVAAGVVRFTHRPVLVVSGEPPSER